MPGDWTHTPCACCHLDACVHSFSRIILADNFSVTFLFRAPKYRPRAVSAMEAPQWTPEMNLHLLHLLTEMPNTPETFPENLPRAGNPKARDKSYYHSMEESGLTP